MADEQAPDDAKQRTGIGLAVGGATIAISLVAFIVQNTVEVRLRWLFIDRTARLWVVIVIAAVAGAVLSEVLGWVIRRRRRQS